MREVAMSNQTLNASTLAVFTQTEIMAFNVMYLVVLCFGLCGNVLTCTVIFLRKSMRRSIHFYTLNLSICDLLILLVYVPTQMLSIQNQMSWRLGLAMCRVANIVLPVSLMCLIGTLLSISIDRARGLIRPFNWRADSRRNAKIIIPAFWFLSVAVSIPLLVQPRLETENDGKVICSEGWSSTSAMLAYWNTMFVLSFLLPLLVIIGAHVIMVYAIFNEHNAMHLSHNKRMIRLIVALVLLFVFCTGFQHVYFYMNTYFEKSLNFSAKTNLLLFVVSNFAVSLKAALNPVIYGTLRHDFNRAFGNMILKLMICIKTRRELRTEFVSTFTRTTEEHINSLRQSFRRVASSSQLPSRITSTYDSPLARRHPSPLLTPGNAPRRSVQFAAQQNNDKMSLLRKIQQMNLETLLIEDTTLMDSPVSEFPYLLQVDDIEFGEIAENWLEQSPETDI